MLHNEDFITYTLHHQIKEEKMGGHVARMGQMRNSYSTFVGIPKWKRPIGRLRRRWKDNIRLDLREVR